MGKKISTCECNKDYENFTESLKVSIGEEGVVTKNKCIGACNSCGYKYIARVNGKLIEREDMEEEIELIKKEIKS